MSNRWWAVGSAADAAINQIATMAAAHAEAVERVSAFYIRLAERGLSMPDNTRLRGETQTLGPKPLS